jgi:hypothetical protein
MALYNVFIPGQHGSQINIAAINKVSGANLTTHRPVGGTMYYGVSATGTQQALNYIQAATGYSYNEAPSVFLQSNDTRQNT